MPSKTRKVLITALEDERKYTIHMINWMEAPHKGVSQRTINRGIRSLKKRLKAVDHLLSMFAK